MRTEELGHVALVSCSAISLPSADAREADVDAVTSDMTPVDVASGLRRDAALTHLHPLSVLARPFLNDLQQGVHTQSEIFRVHALTKSPKPHKFTTKRLPDQKLCPAIQHVQFSQSKTGSMVWSPTLFEGPAFNFAHVD